MPPERAGPGADRAPIWLRMCYTTPNERSGGPVAIQMHVTVAEFDELAVEVVSPNDDNEKLRIKVINYLAAGTLVWVVRPQDQKVEVCAPGRPVKIVDRDGTLDGGDVLPGFKLAVKDIFST